MPAIKLPKAFQRRKSSGDALEQVDSPSTPSFRVIPREEVADRRSTGSLSTTKRFDYTRAQSSPVRKGRQQSPEAVSLDSNRGSNGSSAADSGVSNIYDTSSPSARGSSTSTLPSTVGLEATEDPFSRPLPPKPVASNRHSFFSRGSARTFTFNGRTRGSSIAANPYSETGIDVDSEKNKMARDRAMTTSSYASTALPPKLDDDLHFGTSDFSTDLGSLFSGVGSAPGKAFTPATSAVPSQSHSYSPSYQAQPLKELPSIPQAQQEPRARSPSFVESRSTSDGEDLDAQIVRNSYSATQATSTSRSRDAFGVSPSGRVKGIRPEKQSLLQSQASPSSSPGNSPVTEVHPTNVQSQPHQPARQTTPGPLRDSARASSNNTTPRAKKVELHSEDDEPLFKQGRTVSFQQPSEIQRGKAPETPKRVMTGAEFDKLKREQELSRSKGDASESESEPEDDYEDEDEMERMREQERLRRKQQADLAVHRQKMAKTIGQATPPPPTLNMPQPVSYGLSNQGSSPGGPSGTSSEDDDDVPLGALMAIGFPGKNRPPNPALSGLSAGLPGPSQLDLLPQRPGSASGQSVAGGISRANHPEFARNLPLDPHSGAYGLVSAANRESLGFSRDRSSSIQLQPRPASTPVVSPHGGLISVIANEEAARAMRRGSPNAQGLYGSMLPQAQMAAAPQMPMMGAMPAMPAQDMNMQILQMNQMMMQMMAAQTQIMNNTASGHGFPPQSIPPVPPVPQQYLQQPNNFLAPPSLSRGRPMSMASNAGGMGQYNPRTSSMMNGLSLGGGLAPPAQHHGFPAGRSGYAKSLAPSERSNVGMSSRYRPIVNPDASDNQTVITSSATLTPGAAGAGAGAEGKKKSGMLQATLRTLDGKNPLRRFQSDGAGDDEDEQGWSSMRTRRSKSKEKGRADTGEDLRELYPET